MTAGGIDDTLHELGLYIKHGILRLQETWNVSTKSSGLDKLNLKVIDCMNIQI